MIGSPEVSPCPGYAAKHSLNSAPPTPRKADPAAALIRTPASATVTLAARPAPTSRPTRARCPSWAASFVF